MVYSQEPGYLTLCSDRMDRTGLDSRGIAISFLAGPRDFSDNHIVQIGSRAHQISQPLSTVGSLPKVKEDRQKLATHLHSVSWLKSMEPYLHLALFTTSSLFTFRNYFTLNESDTQLNTGCLERTIQHDCQKEPSHSVYQLKRAFV